MDHRPREISFRTVAQLMYSDHERAEALAFHSREAWSEHLTLMHGARSPRLRTEPDWSTQMLVEVALGERCSSGFSVQVAGITKAGDLLTMRVVEHSPAPGQVLLAVVTQPSVVVVVEAHRVPIALELSDAAPPWRV